MIAWHYTIGQYFVPIMESGAITSAAIYVEPPEKPIVWFSLNQYWEATANKAVIENDTLRTLTMKETFEMGGGLIRFGIDAKKLYTGSTLVRRARMSKAVWAGLIEVGKRQKADPTDWCGSIQPVPVEGLVLEVMNESFKWEAVE